MTDIIEFYQSQPVVNFDLKDCIKNLNQSNLVPKINGIKMSNSFSQKVIPPFILSNIFIFSEICKH